MSCHKVLLKQHIHVARLKIKAIAVIGLFTLPRGWFILWWLEQFTQQLRNECGETQRGMRGRGFECGQQGSCLSMSFAKGITFHFMRALAIGQPSVRPRRISPAPSHSLAVMACRIAQAACAWSCAASLQCLCEIKSNYRSLLMPFYPAGGLWHFDKQKRD